MRQNLFGDILDKISNVKAKDAITQVPKMPRLVDIELTNTCNLKCPFCPTGMGTLKRPKGFMSIGMATFLAMECNKYNIPVRFIRWGEPTLHPNFWGIVKLFKLWDVPIHVGTNGIKLDVDKCIEEEVDSVKISIHSISSWRTAQELIEARGDKAKPYITASYLEGEPEHGKLDADKVTHAKIHPLNENRTSIPECYEVFNKLSVDWDGIVTACCGDYDRKMVITNLKLPGASLKTAWKHYKLKTYRNLIANKKWDELELCKNCARGNASIAVKKG